VSAARPTIDWEGSMLSACTKQQLMVSTFGRLIAGVI
jgi:hypothetical protein